MRTVLLFFLVFASLESRIIEMEKFEDVYSHVDPDTFLILDIDDTLLIPEQMLGCDEWFLFRMENRLRQGIHSSVALENTLAEWEAVRHLSRMQTPETKTAAIVRDLQEKGYSIFGLTTQGLALATRTKQQLLSNGIDLTRTAPSGDDCYFLSEGHGILFRGGILFTSGTDKGIALEKLFDFFSLEPKRILFINDKFSHLKQIENFADRKGIPFLGLRYAFSDANKDRFDPEIAEYQFHHSNFGKLLSDEEAEKALSETSQNTKGVNMNTSSDHVTQEELMSRLKNGEDLVEVGAVYRHYRSGSNYTVTGLAIDEASQNVVVLYRPSDLPVTWSRPLSSWIEKVLEGGVPTDRFRKVPNTNE